MKYLKFRITGLNIGKMLPMAAFFPKSPKCGVHVAFPQQTICQGSLNVFHLILLIFLDKFHLYMSSMSYII